MILLAAAAGASGCGSSKSGQGGGKAGSQGSNDEGGYLQTLVRSKKLAESVAHKAHLTVLGKDLQIYAVSHGGRFPPELEELGDPAVVRAPSGQTYQYIPGQTNSLPHSNILVYEAEPAHDGKVLALRLGGTVELLTPEQLQQAVAETHRSIGK